MSSQTIIENLSRRALRLNGKANFEQVLKEIIYASYQLTRHFKNAPEALNRDFKMEEHPIIQYLVQKLMNLSCPRRENTYYQIENIVKDLAHLEE